MRERGDALAEMVMEKLKAVDGSKMFCAEYDPSMVSTCYLPYQMVKSKYNRRVVFSYLRNSSRKE